MKGDSFLYGEKGMITNPPAPTGNPIALSATQNCATIYSGKNYPAQNNDNPKANPRVDNPKPAETDSGAGVTRGLYVLGTYGTNDQAQINTSIDPILVNKNSLNIGKSPRAITHKIFGGFSYAWKDEKENWMPFFGFGWEVEFAQKSTCDDCCIDCCKTCCNSCCNSCTENCGTCCTAPCSSCCEESKRAGIFQYGVWFKGGFSFD